MSNFDPDNIEMVGLSVKIRNLHTKRFVYPTRKTLKFLSVEYKFPYDFDLEIPVDEIKNKKVTVYVLNGDESFDISITF